MLSREKVPEGPSVFHAVQVEGQRQLLVAASRQTNSPRKLPSASLRAECSYGLVLVETGCRWRLPDLLAFPIKGNQ